MSKVQQVRRKSLILEAIQFVDDAEVVAEIREWMGLEELEVLWDRGAPQLLIVEPDGFGRRVDAGAWVYRTEQGGYRALPDDVYQANFEVVDSGQLIVDSEGEKGDVPSPAAKPLTKAEKKAAEAAAKAAAEESEAKKKAETEKGAEGEGLGESGETLTITGSQGPGSGEAGDGDTA